jgi:hypothetical protein
MPEPNSGCWLWLGKTHGSRAKFKNLSAARAMWRMLQGGPPLGYVYHTCGNPLCVNPGHLYLSTAKSNAPVSLVKRDRANQPVKKLDVVVMAKDQVVPWSSPSPPAVSGAP